MFISKNTDCRARQCTASDTSKLRKIDATFASLLLRLHQSRKAQMQAELTQTDDLRRHDLKKMNDAALGRMTRFMEDLQ